MATTITTNTARSTPVQPRAQSPSQRAIEIHEALIEMLPRYGFDQVDPVLILAQSAHETANYTSSLIVNFNNAFGMKHPSQRPTTSLGPTANGFARYASLHDSVEDYLMRARYFGMPNTDDPVEFVGATVDSGYAEDPGYVSAWTNWYNQLSDPGGTVDTGGGGGIISTDDGPGTDDTGGGGTTVDDSDPPPDDEGNGGGGGADIGDDNDPPPEDIDGNHVPPKDKAGFPWLIVLLLALATTQED